MKPLSKRIEELLRKGDNIDPRLIQYANANSVGFCDSANIIREMQNLIKEASDSLKAVLCDPHGFVCIHGSLGDRQAVQSALEMLDLIYDI